MSDRRREQFRTPGGGQASIELDWSGHFSFRSDATTVECVFPHYYLGIETYEDHVESLLEQGGLWCDSERNEVPARLLEDWFAGGLSWQDGSIVRAVAALGEEAIPEDVDDLIVDDQNFMKMGWRHATRALLTYPKSEIASLELHGANPSALDPFDLQIGLNCLVDLSLPRMNSKAPEWGVIPSRLCFLALSSGELGVLRNRAWPDLRELKIDFQDHELGNLDGIAEAAPALDQVTLSCNFNAHMAIEWFALSTLPRFVNSVFLDDPGGKVIEFEKVLQRHEASLRLIPHLILSSSFAHRIESPPGTLSPILSWENLVWA